jgi:toxin FitB
MILLDSNVLSALLRPEQEPLLVDWLDGLAEDDLCTSAVCVFEVRFGIDRLPTSKRKSKMQSDLGLVLTHIIADRVLPFDVAAAIAAAELRAKRGKAGKSVDVPDTLIAGVALANNCAIATRNVRHFAGLTVDVINPWDPQP